MSIKWYDNRIWMVFFYKRWEWVLLRSLRACILRTLFFLISVNADRIFTSISSFGLPRVFHFKWLSWLVSAQASELNSHPSPLGRKSPAGEVELGMWLDLLVRTKILKRLKIERGSREGLSTLLYPLIAHWTGSASIRELKKATFLSHRRQPEVSSSPT